MVGATIHQHDANAMISVGIFFFVLTFYLKMYIFGSRGSKTYYIGLRLTIQIILLKALNKEFCFYPVSNGIYFGVDFKGMNLH